jgi:hypothetical protein
MIITISSIPTITDNTNSNNNQMQVRADTSIAWDMVIIMGMRRLIMLGTGTEIGIRMGREWMRGLRGGSVSIDRMFAGRTLVLFTLVCIFFRSSNRCLSRREIHGVLG